MDVNRRILMAVAEADVWVLAARRVGVIVALLVGAAAVLCGVAWIAGRWKGTTAAAGKDTSSVGVGADTFSSRGRLGDGGRRPQRGRLLGADRSTPRRGSCR